MSKRVENVWYVYHFTEKERALLAHDLSTGYSELLELKDEKASVVSDFNSRIKEQEANLKATNRKLRDGYEQREAECGVTRDFDKMKVYYHDLMTGELVKERAMLPGDMQLDLDEEDNE